MVGANAPLLVNLRDKVRVLFLPGIMRLSKALPSVRRQGLLICASLVFALGLIFPERAARGDPSLLPGDEDSSLAVTADSIKYFFPPYVVEGTRWNEIEARSDHLITIIGPERLRSRAAFDIGEIVGQSSGVVLNKTGGWGSTELVSIRGSTAQQVLVLLNGRRLNTAQGGGVDISQFAPGEISRIEIYREGNDARWSSDSMGGILNIITSGRGEKGLHARTLGASYGTRSISLGGSAGGRVNLAIRTSFKQSVNDFDFSDPRRGGTRRRVNAGYRSTYFSGNLVTQAEEGRRLDVLISHSKDDRGAPGPIEFPTPNAKLEDDRTYLQGEYADSLGRFDFSAAVGLHHLKRRYVNPDPVLWADDMHRNTIASLALEVQSSLSDGFKLRAGSAYERDLLESTTDGTQNRDSYSVFVSTQIGLLGRSVGSDSRTSLTPGVRLEKITGFPSQLLPSLSLRVSLIPELVILRGSVGKKFRPPSYDELFWPLSSGAEGNPDLLPERSTSAELSGTMYLLGKRARIRTSFFQRRLTDLIEWTPGAKGIWRPHNVGAAREEGFEIEGAFKGKIVGFLPHISLEAHHSIIAATDRGDDPLTRDKQLVRRPGSVSCLSLETYASTRLSIGVSWMRVGKRYLTKTNSKWLDGYDVIDLNMKYSLWKEISLFFSIKNIGGKSYYDVDEFPVPGMTVMAALDFSLKRGVSHERRIPD